MLGLQICTLMLGSMTIFREALAHTSVAVPATVSGLEDDNPFFLGVVGV
jgi:hypothetical protein